MRIILGFKEPAAIIPLDAEAVPSGAATIEEFLRHPGVSAESMHILHSHLQSVRAAGLARVLSIPADRFIETEGRFSSEEPWIYAKIIYSEGNLSLGSKLALFRVDVSVSV